MDLDEAIVGEIMKAKKTIAAAPVLEPKGVYYKARGDVAGVEGFDLAVEVTWNPRSDKASACLFVKHVKPLWSRIYGVDLGEDHHNPDCQLTGDPHRHDKWSVKYGVKFGSAAPDLVGRSVPEMFGMFLEECGIEMPGTLVMPKVQTRLFK